MALGATIYKAELQLSDMDRHHYQMHALTLARHPSETDERMMVRLLAFALYADDSLAFGKGISSEDEPALWRKDLTGEVKLWIELGHPDERDIRRACGRADDVVVVCYGGRASDVWWQANSKGFARLKSLRVIQLPQDETRALTALVNRNMQIQCTIQDGELWFTSEAGEARVIPVTLHPAAT